LGPDDIRAAVGVVAAAIEPAIDGGDWDRPAGQLTWTCRRTLAHLVDCLTWYAANLARRSTGDVATIEPALDTPLPVMVDALRSMGAVLAEVVGAAADTDRGFHPYGICDRSGFAAMGCDEVLVHGYDLAGGLGLTYAPPRDVVERTLRRLFPWAPAGADPWDALLWANGRQPLGDLPPETEWLWHCAPLAEWNGDIRRMR
jgi:hypothetical protein